MAEEVKAPVEEVSAKDGGAASLSHEEYNTWNRYEPTTYHDVLDGGITIHGEAQQVVELMKSFALYYAEVKNPENTAVNAFFKRPDGSASKYSPLNEVLNATRTIMGKYGLGCIQIPITNSELGCGVTTMLTHKSGAYIIFPTLFAQPESKSNPIQALGACITYLRRFALNGIAGVCGEVDDDGNSLQGKEAPKAPVKEKTPQQKIAAMAKEKAKKNRTKVAEIIKEAAGTDSIKDIPENKFEEVYKKLEELPE